MTWSSDWLKQRVLPNKWIGCKRNWQICSVKPCWPIRSWISTGCCWSSRRAARRRSACRRTGRATPACPRPATTTDRRALARAARRPADHALSARRRPVRRRRGPALRRRAAALLDARRQRPLAGLRDRGPTAPACGSSPASSPTWTATTPATCPTARSSSPRPPVSSACRASTAARTSPCCT